MTLRHEAGRPSVEVVDSTGASDAFVAAFMARLALTGDWHEAMVCGVALACTKLGATPSFATADEIAARLASRHTQRQ